MYRENNVWNPRVPMGTRGELRFCHLILVVVDIFSYSDSSIFLAAAVYSYQANGDDDDDVWHD